MAPPSAGPLLKVHASTMVLEMTKVPLRAWCWQDSIAAGTPLPPPKPSQRLADLEVKIDKAQHDVARLQAVVVKKQAELQQAEERADSKSKELRELHAEMLMVKKEVTQVVPLPAPPATLLRGRPFVPLDEEDRGDYDDITPMARDDDAFLGLHHGAF